MEGSVHSTHWPKWVYCMRCGKSAVWTYLLFPGLLVSHE